MWILHVVGLVQRAQNGLDVHVLIVDTLHFNYSIFFAPFTIEKINLLVCIAYPGRPMCST
jgi:hypothetical protein